MAQIGAKIPVARCCNPFNKKGHSYRMQGGKNHLRKITKEFCFQKKLPLENEGKYICSPCQLKFSYNPDDSVKTATKPHIPPFPNASSSHADDSSKNQIRYQQDDVDTEVINKTKEKEDDSDDDFGEVKSEILKEETITNLNKILEILKISPINMSKDHRSMKVQERKVKEIRAALDIELEKVFNIKRDDNNEMSELVDELKKKVSETENKSEKVKYLTMLPISWEIRRIQTTFGISYSMARSAKRIHTEHGIGSSPNPRLGKRLPLETETRVHSFYYDEEISREMPGKRDSILVRKNGIRSTMQKRLLLGNLKEIYVVFKEKNPSCNIGFSKFADLRPTECILAGGKGTHSVCVCKIHQNPKLMISGAKLKQLTEAESDKSFLGSYKEILKEMICSSPTPDCYLLTCKECPGVEKITKSLRDLFDEKFIDQVIYQQWTMTDSSKLETVVDSSDDFINKFCDNLPDLLKHDFISKSQSQHLKDLKESLKPGFFLVLCDFGENYAPVIQDSVQDYYWTNEQITIHPFVVYYKKNGELKHESFMIISESNKHDATAVNLFIKKLIEELKKRHVVEEMIYFTDGAGSQYKNKFNFINLAYHKRDFGMNGTWNFFGTSHGKSPCDGISGTFKRNATKASLQRPLDNQITTPQSLYGWAKDALPNIKSILCSTSDYEEHKKLLELRFSRAQTIDGTRGFHHFEPINEIEIKCKNYSAAPDNTFKVFKIQPEIRTRRMQQESIAKKARRGRSRLA